MKNAFIRSSLALALVLSLSLSILVPSVHADENQATVDSAKAARLSDAGAGFLGLLSIFGALDRAGKQNPGSKESNRAAKPVIIEHATNEVDGMGTGGYVGMTANGSGFSGYSSDAGICTAPAAR